MSGSEAGGPSGPTSGGSPDARRLTDASGGHRLRCSEALAEDACAHAWLQLCRTQPERTENLPGWLRVVALYEGYRLLRQVRREPLVGHRGSARLSGLTRSSPCSTTGRETCCRL